MRAAARGTRQLCCAGMSARKRAPAHCVSIRCAKRAQEGGPHGVEGRPQDVEGRARAVCHLLCQAGSEGDHGATKGVRRGLPAVSMRAPQHMCAPLQGRLAAPWLVSRPARRIWGRIRGRRGLGSEAARGCPGTLPRPAHSAGAEGEPLAAARMACGMPHRPAHEGLARLAAGL